MEMASQLPVDVLLDDLGRLPTRSLAISRSVCTDLLPLSLDGVFLEPRDPDRPFERRRYRPPLLFSRRSTQRKMSDMRRNGKYPSVFQYGLEDCCNGLLLLSAHVYNPATLESSRLPPQPGSCLDPSCDKWMFSRYLVFDPAMSLHYEVVSVPGIPWEQLLTGHVCEDVCTDNYKPAPAAEWPPTPYVMHVFSSKTMEWKERPFVREGEPAGRVADCQSKEKYMCRYAAYWHQALYVPCEDDFVLRVNLSNDTYKVFNLPGGKRSRSHAPRLGKSEKGVHCAFRYARNAFQVWFLDESCGQMEWLLKNDINFDIVHESPCTIVGGSWILQGYSNNEELVEDNSEWDPSNENVVSAEAWVGMPGPSATFHFLGFHPYKEIALFGANGSIMAYHLSNSKVRDLGFIPMWSNEIVSFPYTPCWMGPLPGSNYSTSQFQSEIKVVKISW